MPATSSRAHRAFCKFRYPFSQPYRRVQREIVTGRGMFFQRDPISDRETFAAARINQAITLPVQEQHRTTWRMRRLTISCRSKQLHQGIAPADRPFGSVGRPTLRI